MPFEGDNWGIDCWLLTRDDFEDVMVKRLKEITYHHKTAILQLKYQLIYRGLYGKVYQSVDVYRSVLDYGVIAIEEFLNLNKRN